MAARPTQLVGCELEPGLTELLLQNMHRQSGALPLLQHALLELWKTREGRRLTLKGYHEIGGLEGAVQRHADAIMAGFSVDQTELCRRMFLRLTQPGEGAEDVKRRASLRELLSLAKESTAEYSIVQKLASESLLTIEGNLSEKEAFVEVAHEALIRSWPQLRNWIDADRAGLRTRNRLSESTREWENSGRDSSYLYSGARLAVAREWAGLHPDELSVDEQDFLDASVEADQERQMRLMNAEAARDDQIRKRLDQERKHQMEIDRLHQEHIAREVAAADKKIWPQIPPNKLGPWPGSF
jgi:hypothetical protein